MFDRKVSPLLDAMNVGECFASHDGVRCYYIRHPESGREFVLKHISVPASEDQVQALLLTGAYADETEAEEYYRKEAEALVREAEERKKLLDCPYILPFLGVQMEKKPEGVGYDVFAVLPKRNSLQEYLNGNAVSHLRGINMGIDLCVALSALREEGYVHGNLKPGNVFFSDTGRFLLGDFGLISTQDMQYAILPEQYRSGYTAPELRNFIGGLNPTVDIYSLGMILYRIYNGNHAPFEDEQTGVKAADTRRLEGDALPAPLYADYELTEIIQKACDHDPARRYQTPDEMRVELEQYMRRNAVSDHLIVPPLVTDAEPLPAEEVEEKAEPVSFTDVEKLDDTFKAAFAPKEKKKARTKKVRKEPPEQAQEQEPKQAESVEKDTPAGDETPLLTLERKKAAQKASKRRSRRKKAWILFAVLMFLLVAVIGVYEFTELGQGRYHFFVNVEELTVSEITADSLRLHLSTNINPDDFTAKCHDAYGNTFQSEFRDGVAAFTGLKPGTQYTLQVEVQGLHKVSGTTTVRAATAPLTEILTFTAANGSEKGAVVLGLVVKDETAAPEQWTIQYGVSGKSATVTSFTGRSVQITGLQPGEEYTFRLISEKDVYLAGQTVVSFTPVQEVLADSLALDSVVDGVANISWRCQNDPPEEWIVTCTDPDGNSLEAEIHEPRLEESSYFCSASIPGLVIDTEYTVELKAEGLFVPLQIAVKDNTIVIDSFTAEATEEGLRLSWTPRREPEGGWQISGSIGDSERLEFTAPAAGNSLLLAVLPDAQYNLTLQAADGTPVQGSTSLKASSLPANWFNQLGVNGPSCHIGLYFTPDKPRDEWTERDLGSGTTVLHPGDQATVAVYASGKPAESDETVTVHYVVYDSDGTIVSANRQRVLWNEMWDGTTWYSQVPEIPKTAGKYQLVIFINSRRLAKFDFSVRTS